MVVGDGSCFLVAVKTHHLHRPIKHIYYPGIKNNINEYYRMTSYIIRLTNLLKEHSSYPNSKSLDFNTLTAEWFVSDCGYEAMSTSCLCGKEHIKELNTIKNRYNGVELYPIGSRCVKHFGIEDLEIRCFCCHKEISKNNEYIKAYMQHSKVSTTTSIIGHKKCIEKFNKGLRLHGRYGYYIDKNAKQYLEILGVILQCNRKTGEMTIEYPGSLQAYMDLLQL